MATRRKTYKLRGGDVYDVEEYPDGRYGAKGKARQKKKKPTPEQMAAVNQANRAKICRRLLIEYFDAGDYFVTYTYKVEQDGLLMALEIVKNEGVEALEKEIKFRNVTGIRTALAKKDINRATIKIKEQTVDTVTILSVATLHDEFGFGTQRCDRFIKRFNKKAECIMDDMASWNDYIKTIKEELGIELGIRENK